MVSAGASGEAISGDFLNPDEPWTIRGQRQHRGSGGIPSWADSPSVSPAKDRGNRASRSRGTREEALRRAANAVSGAGRDQEGPGSWTPRREGQGSWDKTRSKAAELALPVWLVDLKRGVCTGDITMSQPIGLELAECDGGVCVSRVLPGCIAERQGVRVGDRVVATSATVGNGLWEKTTVDGILSAVGTRFVFTDTVTLRVERPLEPHQLANARFKDTVTQTVEVTLEKPPGLILEQITDPSGNGDPVGVFVAGITPGSPADLCGEVECGDRVVAVTGSLGNQMWPHRRLEGVESAIDTRIGTTVTLRLERAAKLGSWSGTSAIAEEEESQAADAKVQAHEFGASAPAVSASLVADTASSVGIGDVAQQRGEDEARAAVLEKCEALVRSYGVRGQAFAVDKLLEQMAEAGVQINARFLNSAMLAYLMCKEPQKAVDTFQAVTGIAWPELPPWPDLSLPKARTHTRSVSSKKRRQLERTTKKGVDPYKSVPMPSNMTLKRDELGRSSDLPAEFLELKAGPAHAEDDSEPLEMTTEERGAMAGERFLQLREVESTGEEAPALAPGPYVGNCRPNALLLATVVKAHGRRRRLDDACRAVQRMEDWGLRPDAAVFNALAAAAVWNGRLDLALEVVLGGMMNAWGVEPDQLSYNTIMDAFARAGNVVSVEKIFNFMLSEGLPPDVVTTTTLVKAQVTSGDLASALSTLLGMLRTSHIRSELDAFPFNTIIQGMMKTNLWERAMEVYRSMKLYDIQPDIITFNSLIAGLVKANKADLAAEIFEEMAAAEVTPDVYSYSSLASAHAKLADVAAAVKTLSIMSKAGIRPNRFTCSSVMQACVRGERPEMALQVYEKLIKTGGLKTDEVIETLVVQANAMLGRFEAAFEVVTAMGRNGQDEKLPLNHLLTECVRAAEWEKASEVVRRMLHDAKGGQGIRLDSNTFRALSLIPDEYDGTQAKSWPRLKFLMDTKELVLERGWTYSSTLYLALLEECVSREDYKLGYMVMEDRKGDRVYVHKHDWSALEWIEDRISFKVERRVIDARVKRK